MFRAVAFGLDSASLAALHEAIPDWTIDVVDGATSESLAEDWNPDTADLLVVGSRDDVVETLSLCRFLAFCTRYSKDFRRESELTPLDAPILVVVSPGQESLANAALRAGAHGCLTQPITSLQVINMLASARKSQQLESEDGGRHSDNRTMALHSTSNINGTLSC